MTSKFLITRPTHEFRIKYLYYWGREILKFAENKNITFSDFRDEKANRKNVEKYLKKQSPRLIIFNGHGSPTVISGHNDEPLIVSGENENLLKSKIVYAISCDAAECLGKEAVRKNCETFIGYEGPFSFTYDVAKICTPVKDKLAEPFKKTSNIISISLLKGKSAGEAAEKSKNLALELMREYSISDVEPGYKDIRFWLFWNRFFLKVIGNPRAKF